MSRPIRVLICDDSATIRRLLDRLLRESGEIEVVGQAVHGEDALRQIPTARPDVLLLDLEMPVLDGLSTLRKLRERDRYLPVIVFSALTQEGSRATLDALALGAHDYVTKPSAKGTIATQLAETREQLVPRVIALGRRAAGRSTKGRPTGPPPSMPNRPELVAIGASTGGPQALTEILARFPQPFP
ncbi:MAG: response regulator, partial [Myxococcales bacterium]|nr:response regulator [Myxococcales bacterium]